MVSCFIHFISVLVSFQFSLLVMANRFKMWMQSRMSDLYVCLKNRKSFMDMVYKNLSYISKEEEARVSQNNTMSINNSNDRNLCTKFKLRKIFGEILFQYLAIDSKITPHR